MNRQMTCGTSSISFQNPVFVQSCASVVSQKEGEGPLGAYFDTICEDPMFGTDTWEAAESTLQKQTAGQLPGNFFCCRQDRRHLC